MSMSKILTAEEIAELRKTKDDACAFNSWAEVIGVTRFDTLAASHALLEDESGIVHAHNKMLAEERDGLYSQVALLQERLKQTEMYVRSGTFRSLYQTLQERNTLMQELVEEFMHLLGTGAISVTDGTTLNDMKRLDLLESRARAALGEKQG